MEVPMLTKRLFLVVVTVFLSFQIDMWKGGVYNLELAHIIAGEAGICPTEAKVGVAYVFQRNKVFYGYATPTKWDVFIAQNFEYFPDYSKGAFFAVSEHDKRYVKLGKLLGVELASYGCVDGYRIYFHARRSVDK